MPARVVSQRDAELDAAIQQQDKLYVAAIVEGVSPQFVERILAVRNDLSREQAAEWHRAAGGV